jgi:hypothetical protein
MAMSSFPRLDSSPRLAYGNELFPKVKPIRIELFSKAEHMKAKLFL